MVPQSSFFPENDTADELTRQVALLLPSAVPCSLASLTSRIRSSHGLETYTHLNSLTHRFPQYPLRNLCSLVIFAVSSCCLCYNGHSLLLNSSLSRIGRSENPSCSTCGHSTQCTCHLIVHCPATDSLRTWLFGDFSLYKLSYTPWKVTLLMRLHGLSPCLHLTEWAR